MRISNYDKLPTRTVTGGEGAACSGAQAAASALKKALSDRKDAVLTVDCYPGVDVPALKACLSALDGTFFYSEDCAVPSGVLDARLEKVLTDDRVFGHMTTASLSDAFLPEKLSEMRGEIARTAGLKIVLGVGAALVTRGDVLVVADISRWEIQLRYRRGMGNWHTENGDAPQLTKYKRGFFAEWRWADAHKRGLLREMDFFLDANRADSPVLVTGDGVRRGLSELSGVPFRTVPYFDPGVWGGQWMKEVCGLSRDTENFAWSFDGVPEENAVRLDFGGVTAEMPAMNLVLSHPEALLGTRVFERFGAEFPIRFDFLDTMDGANLSLQVHPLKRYIKEQFGMAYTQDESYYFLDAGEDACVYLGLKTGVDPEEMMAALHAAERGEKPFEAERFVNRFPVKKHDHVLIPAGTVHCSGTNGMVLEISATPYIFTFKLWDWGRVGLDGLPRPIHLDHGERNIDWSRDTAWVEANLLHREELLKEDDAARVERTGLHALEPIETRRYTACAQTPLDFDDTVRMCNLVEGEAAVIKSADGRFEPFTVHYAETFILPAACGACTVTPCAGEIKLMLAVVRP